MKPTELACLVVILLSFAASFYFYGQLPERFASHWNMQGEVDGYIPRLWGILLLPTIITGLWLLFLAIPRIDPRKKNIEKFRAYYDGFIVLLFVFLLAVHLQTLLWNIGILIPLSMTLPIGIGILFFYIGVLLSHAKRNWFIGIRTPWTLSSDSVWNKTHKAGAKLFKLAGVIALFGAILQEYAFLLILVPVIAAAAYATAYSYFEYRKQKKR